MVMEDPIETAKAAVAAGVAECEAEYGVHPVVVCLSHSGTSGGKGEDYELAEAVEGIDVIISGHTHTTLREPVQVNGTLIVSAAEYGRNLGVLKLRKDGDGVVLNSVCVLFENCGILAREREGRMEGVGHTENPMGEVHTVRTEVYHRSAPTLPRVIEMFWQPILSAAGMAIAKAHIVQFSKLSA
jgi:hypothetical protein